MTRTAINARFEDDGKETIHLTDIQRQARDVIRAKILCHEYDMVDVDCPLCGENDYTVIASKDFYGFPVRTVVCHHCALVYASPRLSHEALGQMYAIEYRDLDRARPSSQDYFQLEFDKAQATFSYLQSNGLGGRIDKKLVVEVGCGAGGGLSFFESLGCDAVGCDLSPKNVDFGKEKNLQIHYGDLDTLIDAVGDRVGDIGLVIYEQVFEHLTDPGAELAKLRGWLPSDALIYICVPGLKNISAQYGSDLMRYLQIPHLCHFELETLTAFTRQQGYDRIAGDELARGVFQYEVAVPKPLMRSDYQDVLSYIDRLERRRAVVAPMAAARNFPVYAGVWLGQKVRGTTFLPAAMREGLFSGLRSVYHRLFR